MNIASSSHRIAASWQAIVEHLNPREAATTLQPSPTFVSKFLATGGSFFWSFDDGREDTWLFN
jgi:hypothetical protein